MVFVFHFLASFQRGEGRRIMGERRERVKSRNMYKGTTYKDNGVGIIFGNGGWTGHGRARGEMWTTVSEEQ